MKRRSFFKGLFGAYAAISGYFSVKYFSEKDNQSNDNINKYINSKTNLKKRGLGVIVEIPIVYHCNLNCAGCDHFASIAPSYIMPVEVFKKDVASLIKQYNDYSVRYGWKCASKEYYNATYLNNKDIHLCYGILNQNSAEPTLYVAKRGSSDITIVDSIEDAYQVIKPMYLKRYLENGKELADKYNYY